MARWFTFEHRKWAEASHIFRIFFRPRGWFLTILWRDDMGWIDRDGTYRASKKLYWVRGRLNG